MSGFTPEDLRKMGLVQQSNGRFAKVKKEVKKPVKEIAKLNDYKGHIWIPSNVPSLKNSKQIFRKKNKKGIAVPFIASSAGALKYKEDAASYYQKYASVFLSIVKDMDPPYYVQFVFVRSSKRKFDFNNANHMVTDMMVKHGWIEDDDTTILLPVPKFTAPANYVNPKKPGVWITVKKFK
jgi:hypothetical protein